MTAPAFHIADPGDAKAIAELLDTSTLPGWITLSFRAAAGRHGPLHPGARIRTLIGPAGMATRSVLPGFFNGQPAEIGYIGLLRIAPAFRHHPKLLRAACDQFRAQVHNADETPWYVASILSDNTAAKRLLTANLPGLPKFTQINDYHTLAFRPKTARNTADVRQATAQDIPALIDFINGQNQSRPLAPRLTPGDFTTTAWPNLRPADFLIAQSNGQITGTIALWDQRPHHQIHVSAYAPPLGPLRGIVNAIAPLIGQPHLPAIGQTLGTAALSFFTTAPDDGKTAVALITAARHLAHARGLQLTTLGLCTDDPLLPILCKTLRHRRYDSCIYGVTWQDGETLPDPKLFAGMKLDIGLL
ncbi:MAG: hypothetical protein WCC57_14565 [Paracoccaceae bacterium]